MTAPRGYPPHQILTSLIAAPQGTADAAAASPFVNEM